MEINLELVSVDVAETVEENQEIGNLKAYYHWSCDACGGDSDTGCLMSDPDNCVRG
jgi:hypothetical protein